MFQRCYGCMRPLPYPDAPCPHCGYDKRMVAFNRSHLEPGTMLCGRYVIGRPMGLGSFGNTYIGWDTAKDIAVTVKEFLPTEFAVHRLGDTTIQFLSDEGRERFEQGLAHFTQTVEVVHSLEHLDSVNPIIDLIRENGTAYTVSEYLHGRTLKVFLSEYRALTFADAMAIMTPVLQTLDAVHQHGILHRDVCPDNIFICDDGQVKLLDFGLSQFDLLQNTQGLSIILKPGFAPVENYVHHLASGAWTDVYGAAATLYKMLTGIVPPDAMARQREDTLTRPSELDSDIPPESEKALLRALSLSPENRYATAEAFLNALLADEEEEHTPVRISKKTVGIIAACLVALVAVCICFAAVRSRKPNAPVVSESTTEDALQLPEEIRETYFDGFSPDAVEQVRTAKGESVSVSLCIYTKNGKKGLVDQNGTSVLDAEYTAIVWDEAKQAFLLDGTKTWLPAGESPSVPSEAASAAPNLAGSTYQYSSEDYTLYRVLADGTRIVQPNAEGSVLVRNGNRYGIATRGTLLVDTIYENATPLSCGVSALFKDGNWVYYNTYGVNILNAEFPADIFPNGIPYSFSEGYVPFYDAQSKAWGYADTAGNVVIEPKYLSALPPVQSKAWVQTEKGFAQIRFVETDRLTAACGENAQFTYSPENGLLQIDGFGALWDFDENNVPWLSVRKEIRTVLISGNISAIGSCAFADCTALTSISLPSDVSVIGAFAFRNCGKLRMLTLPQALQYIGDEAFAGCGSIVDISVPGALQFLGLSAFRDCTALQNLNLSGDGLRVADYACSGCAALTAVTLSGNGVTIGDYTFDGCAALRDVSLPSRMSDIGVCAFRGCAALQTIHIPLGLTVLRTSVFQDCAALSELTLPDGLLTIEQSAFEGCANLGSLSLPPTLTTISARAFYGCRGLQNALVPKSVTCIDDYAFAGCTGITTFDLGDVRTLGSHVFEGWTARQTIRVRNAMLKKLGMTPLGWASDWDADCYAAIG